MEMDSNLHFTNDPRWVRLDRSRSRWSAIRTGAGRVTQASSALPRGVAWSHPTLISPILAPSRWLGVSIVWAHNGLRGPVPVAGPIRAGG